MPISAALAESPDRFSVQELMINTHYEHQKKKRSLEMVRKRLYGVKTEEKEILLVLKKSWRSRRGVD